MLYTAEDNKKLNKVILRESDTKIKTELVDTEYMDAFHAARDEWEGEWVYDDD
jgi:hypothetical protein